MKKLLALTLLLICASGGQAATMVQSMSLTDTLRGTRSFTMFAGTPGDFTLNDLYRLDQQGLGSFQQFNPASGILNAVTIQIAGPLTSTYDAYASNTSGSSVSVAADTAVALAVSVPRTGMNNQLRAFSSYGNSVDCFGEGSCDTVPDSTVWANDFVDVSDQFSENILLDTFTGTGILSDVEIVLYGALTSMTSSDDFAAIDIWSEFDGSITITYDYTATVVPLPAAVWLFGSGLLGLIGLSRKKGTVVSS